MDETARRPGGLTALAVLNFVFGGILVLLFASHLFALNVTEEMIRGADEKTREAFKQLQEPEFRRLLTISVIVEGVASTLLIASGVGYLKQRRWGRLLGNLGALVGIGIAVLMSWEEGVNVLAMIFGAYPLVTLLLLNTTFRDDFHR